MLVATVNAPGLPSEGDVVMHSGLPRLSMPPRVLTAGLGVGEPGEGDTILVEEAGPAVAGSAARTTAAGGEATPTPNGEEVVEVAPAACAGATTPPLRPPLGVLGVLRWARRGVDSPAEARRCDLAADSLRNCANLLSSAATI